MKTLELTLVFLSALGLASGDILHLKNGVGLDGTMIGADARDVQFVGPDGVARKFSISGLTGVEFSPRVTAAASPPPASPPAPRPQPAPQAGVVIPAGTPITVRLIDGIDSTKTAASERFRASIDDPVVVGNDVVIPRGATCTVQVVQVEQNKEMAVKLYDVTVNGRAYDVVASYAQLQAQGTSKGKKTARRAVGLGGIGAGIGAIAGGGTGAAIGAAAGAGLGAISGATSKGKSLKVPSETRLNFELRAPLKLS